MKFTPPRRSEVPSARVLSCWSCGGLLVRHAILKIYRCLNANCPAFDRWVRLAGADDA